VGRVVKTARFGFVGLGSRCFGVRRVGMRFLWRGMHRFAVSLGLISVTL
jgi:hypothetical protein